MRDLCFIFDMDGTLVDSERLAIQALIELVPNIGVDQETLLHAYRGVKLNVMFADVNAKYQAGLPDDFEPTFRAHCAVLFEQELQSFPGTYDMLSQLSSTKCIASSGPLAKIKNSLRITGLAPFFGDNLFSAYQINTWKPDPALFLHAANQMQYSPDQCVVIEDSEVGIEAAEAAGMRAFHFTTSPIKPVHINYQPFSSMNELATLLTNLEQKT